MNEPGIVLADDSLLLTADDVARSWRCSSAFVRILAARGELPAVRLGRAVRFRPSDVRRFVTEHSSGAVDAPALRVIGGRR